MTRLAQASMESGAALSEGMQPLIGNVSFATDQAFTQSHALKMASNAADNSQVTFAIAMATNRTYYQRANVYVASGTVLQTISLMTIGNDTVGCYQQLTLDADGHLYADQSNGSGALSHVDLGACPRNQWLCIEVATRLNSSGNDTVDVRINGVAVGTQSSVALSSTAPAVASLIYSGEEGHTPGVAVWINDWALNDDQGSSQNSWCGPGAVRLLLPTGDSAKGTGWQKPGGSTTNLYTSLDDAPPTGVASTTSSGNAEKQIRNATNTTTSNYDATLQTYAAAGIGSGDTINLVQPVAITGRAGTAINLGLAGVSNPASTEISAAAGSATAGTFPSNWTRRLGTIVYAPSVTPGTAPVVRVGKRTGSTADVMVAQMGLLVDSTPDPSLVPFRSSSERVWTNSTTAPTTLPTGVQDGDTLTLLFCTDYLTIPLPTGWVEKESVRQTESGVNDLIAKVYTARYDSTGVNGVSAAPTLTWGGSSHYNIWWMGAFENADPLSPVDIHGTALSNTATTAPTSPDETTTSDGDTLVWFAFNNNGTGTITLPAGFTPRFAAGGNGFNVGTEFQASAGAIGAQAGSQSSDSWVAGIVALRVPRPAPDQPNLPIRDAFDRPDGGLGSKWTTLLHAPRIVSGMVQPPASSPFNSQAYLNTLTPEDDQGARVRVVALPSTGPFVDVTVRVDPATGEGYYAEMDQDGDVTLYYVNASGVPTTLGTVVNSSTPDATWAFSDFLALTAVGTTLSLWRLPDGETTYLWLGSWEHSARSSGRIGFYIDGTGATQLDDFGGGSLAGDATTPTGLTAHAGDEQIVLSCDVATGATGYHFYRDGVQVYEGSSPAFTDTGLTNGTEYSYTVSSHSATGESDQSSTVTATPQEPGPVLDGIYIGNGQVGDLADWESYVGWTYPLILDFSSTFDTWAHIEDPSYTLAQWEDRVDGGTQLVLSVPMLATGATLAAGAAGTYDSHWTAFAGVLADFSPTYDNIIIRLGWEFDGTWYPWTITASGGPANFITYWRRIHGILVGALPGLTFDWCCANNSGVDITEAYPGDAYVDYIGVDAYDQSYVTGYADFDTRWAAIVNDDNGLQAVADLAASHGKPMSIPEWGVTIRDDGHGGGDEPRYITAIADFIADPANNVAYEAYFNFSEAGNEHDLWDDDSFPLSSAQYLEDFPISGVPDVTPPVATVTSGPTLPKISSQTGKNATDFTFTVSEAYEAYELRVVDDDSTSRLSGALIESGGSGDGTARTVEVTFSELNAASAGNGSKVVKVFVQDSAGNWSA